MEPREEARGGGGGEGVEEGGGETPRERHERFKLERALKDLRQELGGIVDDDSD